MHGVVLLLIGVLGSGGVAEYSRSLGARNLDQATLDTEGYGEKKSFKREEDGLRITLSPGDMETGWRTPQQLRFGGDFTISAEFVIKKLPKPAIEDGAAIGLAIAFGDINQPDVTLVRLLETNGSDVYRSIQKEGGNPMPMPMQAQTRVQMRMQMMQMGGGMQPGGKPPKPPRRTFPAAGDVVRMELQREGTTIRVQVFDKKSARPRYLGQVTLGPSDVSAVKLFATNRNGAEAVNVLLRDLTIHADRINGLGTLVRTVFDEVIYADPTSMENGVLTLGGQLKAPVSSNLPDLPEVVFADPQAGSKPRENKAPSGAARAQAVAPSRQPAPQKPKARIPLDELESIRFERPPALAARFMGQPNLDFTMPGLSAEKDGAKKGEAKKDGTKPTDAAAKKADGSDDVLAPPPGTTAPTKIAKVEPKKNGIRDLYLSLSGLRAAKIKQITVNCQTDKGRTSWRLDTTGSQDWPLVIRRSGTEMSADLFLEPPPGDCHQKDFTIAVNYEDGQAANTTAKVGEHTNSGLAFDPKAPAVAWPDAWLHLTGEEKLFGKLEGIDQETLRLATPWDHLDVPLTRVLGVHIGLLDRKETPESFSKRLKARGSEDLLLAQTKKGEVLAIPGIVEGTERDKLRFRYQNQSRTLPLQQVESLVMATRPESRRDDELRPTFSLIGGAVVSGRWKDLDTSVWKIDTAWGQALNLPAAEIQGVRFRGGKMSYLSDLNPGKVEETPFFGHRLSWRRDVSLVGAPLRMNGLAYDRGVAVHSRCILTYDLSGRYSTFEALVGFDDAVQGKGRVDCRVVADGKELYANPDLRADGPPVKLKLPVAGAEQLRLVVDFGRGQDTGDRVIWANARLYRPSPSKTSAPATASRGNSTPESGK